MALRESAAGATLLGALLFVVQFASEAVGELFTDGGVGWLPQLSTVGTTVTVYLYLLRGLGFVLSIAAVFVLGYWAGSRLDLKTDYRRFVLALGAGGALGYLVAGVAGIVATEGATGVTTLDLFSLVTLLVGIGIPLGVGIQFAVVGFAGAAFAHVAGETDNDGIFHRTDDDSPGFVPDSLD